MCSGVFDMAEAISWYKSFSAFETCREYQSRSLTWIVADEVPKMISDQ